MIPPDEPLGEMQILRRTFTVHRRHGDTKARHQFILTNHYGHQYFVSDFGPRYKLHVTDAAKNAIRINGMNRSLFAAFGVEA